MTATAGERVVSKIPVVRFRVDEPLWDFWRRLPDGHRSAEARKWMKCWMTAAEEDSPEKWDKMLEEHEPFVLYARKKKAEYQELERQALSNLDSQQRQKENSLKKLMEGFGRYAYRVEDVPPTVLRNYAEIMEISVQEIKTLLVAEAKKKGMI